jgi:cyclopropane-fatty-acyl-phospholipid synthase
MSVLSAPQALESLRPRNEAPGLSDAVSRLLPETAPKTASVTQRMTRKLIFSLLQGIRCARLTVIDADGTYVFGRPDAPLSARITVRDPAVYRRILQGGNLAAGESFVDGDWDCDDPVTVCRIFILEDQLLNGSVPGILRLMRPATWLLHALRRNTRAGSQRNIAAHYDLGNEFYQLFLDEQLMYSSAIYPHENSCLDEAARYKNERICRKLGLQPGHTLLEIGTGWGGFALHAAGEYGCHVTTTTLSRQQYELARQRVADAGLGHLIDVRLEDYRDLQGAYDRIVSIEMIEAVGYQYLDTYFEQCARLLTPQGRMLVQGITLPEWAWDRHKSSVDFMKRYIFPGCSLISIGGVAKALTGTDLRWENLEDIGPHYARTLRDWRSRFHQRLDDVLQLGFDQRFVRMWDFYLASCEAAFEERYTSNVQILLARGAERGASLLPLLPRNLVT